MLIACTRPRPIDLSRTEILPSPGREAGIARSSPLMNGSEKNARQRRAHVALAVRTGVEANSPMS
jgi:hypothetical protein